MKKKEAKCVSSLCLLLFPRSPFFHNRYLQIFTPLEPTVHEITQYHFEKVPSKTRELRPDTLANMLAMANVQPGSRLLVVENIGGLIVAAAVERMGGSFSILSLAPSSTVCSLRFSSQAKVAFSLSTTPTLLPTFTSSNPSTSPPTTSPRSPRFTGPRRTRTGRRLSCRSS
jgi:tRNA (adenine-N(1)-)-methyltransferase non-catalytic subunit